MIVLRGYMFIFRAYIAHLLNDYWILFLFFSLLILRIEDNTQNLNDIDEDLSKLFYTIHYNEREKIACIMQFETLCMILEIFDLYLKDFIAHYSDVS
jgi:hypothetical protein